MSIGLVRPRITGTQMDREDFTAVGVAVVDARDEGGVPVSALVVTFDVFLIGMSGHKGVVHIDNQRITRRVLSRWSPAPGGNVPDSFPQPSAQGGQPCSKRAPSAAMRSKNREMVALEGARPKTDGWALSMSRSLTKLPPPISITDNAPRMLPVRWRAPVGTNCPSRSSATCPTPMASMNVVMVFNPACDTRS